MSLDTFLTITRVFPPSRAPADDPDESQRGTDRARRMRPPANEEGDTGFFLGVSFWFSRRRERFFSFAAADDAREGIKKHGSGGVLRGLEARAERSELLNA